MSEPGTRAWEEARAERAEAEIERLRAALKEIAHVPARVMKWPDPVDRLLYIAKTAREALSAK